MGHKDTKELNIAITGIHAGDNPQPGVPVIRSLRMSKHRGKIIGFSYDALETGIYDTTLCDSIFTVPYPSEGSEVLIKRIEYIHNKEHIDVLIPTLDAELLSYIKIEPKLEKLGIKMFLPTEEQLKVRSKGKLGELKNKHNINVPNHKLISDINEAYRIGDTFTYPVVVKGLYYEAYVAHNPQEVMQYFSNIRANWGLPIVVQEHITGEEYDVVAVGDGKGKCISAVPIRKMYLTDKGKAWAGISIKDNKLIELTNDLFAKIKWRGPCEVECIKANSDGEYYLIEMNPRFPAWCYLATAVGHNQAEAVVKLACGENLDPFGDYEAGKFFVRHALDIIGDMSSLEALTTKGELHINSSKQELQ